MIVIRAKLGTIRMLDEAGGPPSYAVRILATGIDGFIPLDADRVEWARHARASGVPLVLTISEEAVT